jgi:hypothetical protein
MLDTEEVTGSNPVSPTSIRQPLICGNADQGLFRRVLTKNLLAPPAMSSSPGATLSRFARPQLPVARILTSSDISQEIVRTMAGGIGLVAAVPVTTALATLVVRSLQHGARTKLAVQPQPMSKSAAG